MTEFLCHQGLVKDHEFIYYSLPTLQQNLQFSTIISHAERKDNTW